VSIDQRRALEARLDHLREMVPFEVFMRRAIANRVHLQWANQFAEEQDLRRERLEGILGDYDYELWRRHIITPQQRIEMRDALAKVPTGVRADLTRQSAVLGDGVMRHLGADPRRRVAEVRCWIIDAIDHLDALEFYECRKLLVDAVHQLEFMLTHLPQNDRPSRNRLEFDYPLRERVQAVANSLRGHVSDLREVAS
jgi:hypothetical protein